jgi:tRNA (guanine10-N2)-dimethyltransferase
MGDENLFIYNINYYEGEETLCNTEIKYIFGIIPDKKYFFIDDYTDVNRSPFVKSCLKIILTADSLEEMISKIYANNIYYDKFKIRHLDYTNHTDYKTKRQIESEIGYVINGLAKIHNPNITLGITNIDDKWYLGEYSLNEGLWHLHNSKPHQYSNALPTLIAKALVNIAVGTNLKCTVVDPCCGSGTVVIEALSMGIYITGYDNNSKMVEGAKRNLEFFGYEDVIHESDICNIDKHFDISIIDLPYNLFSATTEANQIKIIKNAARISDKMLLVTTVDMDSYIREAGFSIIDRSYVDKGYKFRRLITLCEIIPKVN